MFCLKRVAAMLFLPLPRNTLSFDTTHDRVATRTTLTAKDGLLSMVAGHRAPFRYRIRLSTHDSPGIYNLEAIQ